MTRTIPDVDLWQGMMNAIIFASNQHRIAEHIFMGRLYCPRCKTRQTHHFISHDFSSLYFPQYNANYEPTIEDLESIAERFINKAIEGNCANCHSDVVTLIYRSSSGLRQTLNFSAPGGASSPNAPGIVSHYLEQAFISSNAGAYSAAVSMNRAALDGLLYDQGYTNGMCGNKIGALEKDIDSGSGPSWTRNLDLELLQVIKDLGNESSHPTPENLEAQLKHDEELTSSSEIVFDFLLDKIYEEPARLSRSKEKLISHRVKAKTRKS